MAAIPAAAGCYVNTLPAGTLQTCNGNNLAAAAMDTLDVTAVRVAPTLKKAFSPASITRRTGVSTLTLILGNASLTEPPVDKLPDIRGCGRCCHRKNPSEADAAEGFSLLLDCMFWESVPARTDRSVGERLAARFPYFAIDSATASATLMPSTAADRMPPA
ncbi:hypothetical protein [Massilia psychrophila]|uniref:hypothetical protein n=1 Tax=Massilia psychrophila TaxID=1603353 RepID=UPI001180D228|nr:hypothetical protein [Massilia psychrophila]